MKWKKVRKKTGGLGRESELPMNKCMQQRPQVVVGLKSAQFARWVKNKCNHPRAGSKRQVPSPTHLPPPITLPPIPHSLLLLHTIWYKVVRQNKNKKLWNMYYSIRKFQVDLLQSFYLGFDTILHELWRSWRMASFGILQRFFFPAAKSR